MSVQMVELELPSLTRVGVNFEAGRQRRSLLAAAKSGIRYLWRLCQSLQA